MTLIQLTDDESKHSLSPFAFYSTYLPTYLYKGILLGHFHSQILIKDLRVKMEFQPFFVFILFAIFIFASTTHSAPFDGDAEEFQSRFY